MDAKQLGQAGLVGWRGRLGRKVADGLGGRTRLDAETIAAAIGLYLVISRTRRMVQMIRRMQRGDTS